MNIGKQIQSLRKQKNITQEVLAAEMGVSVAAVSKWENGNSMPDIVMLCALADFFQVTTDELLGRNKQEEFIICDDEGIVREALSNIIMKEGYHRITLTKNGKQLLDALDKKKPNMIFLDINLPDMNGLELLKKIKERSPKIKVIMVTADTSEETKNQAIQLGADAYITKPFPPKLVKIVIDNHMI